MKAPLVRARRLGIVTAVLLPASAARAGVDTSVVFDIGVRGEVLGGDLDSRFQLERARLSGTGGRFSGGGVRGTFGSIAGSEFDLSLSRRGFNGLNTSFESGSLTTTLFGGTVSGRGLLGRRTTEPLYGLRSSWMLDKKFQLSASGLWTPGASERDGGFIGALSLGYQPRRSTLFSIEAARSQNGMGLQLVATHRERSLTARAVVRRADAGFSIAANPDLRARRSGFLLDGSVRRGDFSLGLGTRRFDGGREGRDNFDRATLGFHKRGLPSVSLYFGSGERLLLPFSLQTEDEEDDPLLATQTRNLGLQVQHLFGSTQTSLSFDRGTSRLVGTPDSTQSADRFNVSLSRPFATRFNVNALQSWALSSRTQQNARAVGSVSQVFVSRDWTSGARAVFGLGREETRTISRGSSRFVAQTQLQLPVARDTAIGLSYRALLSGPGAGIADDRFRIHVRRLFNFGPKRAANARTSKQRRVLGRIEGRVFDDLNLNGRFDEGEPPVAGVSISLRGNLQSQTKRDGAWNFADLSPQTYAVRLETNTLPMELSILGASEKQVSLSAKGVAVVDFPAVRAGTVHGLVFEDTNRNGARDEGEKPINDALVTVEGSEVICFSNARGEFTLSNLPPRAWKIKVDTTFLGGNFQTTSPAPIEVNVLPGGVVRDVLLGVAEPPPEVVSSFIGSG